jgi:urea carboxylase
MFDKVLIANRGAIACRIIRTLKRLGIASVAVYSEADRFSAHVAQANEAICIGPAAAAQSYLAVDKILAAARASGAQAIHPGYGFLSENAAFADACAAAGIVFIGPEARHLREFGLKNTARALAADSGAPLLPGSELLRDVAHAQAEAQRIGYPLMLKSSAGGGGIGMQLIRHPRELGAAFDSVLRLARANFNDAGIFLEKFVEHARHIEVQIVGDGAGGVVHLGERDCSVQRRNQKVVEETPAPNLSAHLRQQICDTAVMLARAVDYRSVGTVEFILDADTDAFYFLEVNTRLQVEHGVTEQVTGVDLVEWMLRIAAGESPLAAYTHAPLGHAIQVRLYAEDPGKNFQPASGLLTEVAFPADARIETWIETGSEISPYYDPMLAKLIVTAPDRAAAVDALARALAQTRLAGIETNLAYLRQIAADAVFVAGAQTTRYLGELAYRANTLGVLEPGVQSSVQDWPGRQGYWHVGVPPSGPMDARAFRLGNRLLGNADDAAGLELTLVGPTLRFNGASTIVLTGARMAATLDGAPLAYGVAHAVAAGSVLKLGAIVGGGCRSYLCVAGGIDVPLYLGSRATFALGQFGGHGGRCLRAGDVLHLGEKHAPAQRALPPELLPTYPDDWEIRVLYGPHGAPDFFTDADIEQFFATAWEVHYNSSRTGVRLIGPKPQWARADGGDAGLHPSNIHDNAYAIGAVDFTGDMPVILGPDGPSLGGFVCPATIIAAELWKLGQLRPGNRVRFVRVGPDEAQRRDLAQRASIATLRLHDPAPLAETLPDAVLHRIAADAQTVAVTYRVAGDCYLLVEYGALELDLALRFRVHALMQALAAAALPGIVDLTPGIRSLQVHYDPRRLPRADLMDALLQAEAALPADDDLSVPTRIVHLPLSWDDPATRLAIDKYMQGVRRDAPWCPSNLEFIRRINGLDSIEAVQRIVFDASYLVLGLGDVYLGAPVATPLDPRHRLVTTKYNPARTWTPENAVGIGGAYLCVYGMEGPGGYQFVGRTLQMWNRYKCTAEFSPGAPWLLRFFDQIRFYPVSADELLALRADFIQGRCPLRIEHGEFSFAEYRAFLADNADSISRFRSTQQAAFAAERERWQTQTPTDDSATFDVAADEPAAPPGSIAIASQVAGSVWKVLVEVGERVVPGQALCIVESMKMEISVAATAVGEVVHIEVAEGSPIAAGQTLLFMKAVRG